MDTSVHAPLAFTLVVWACLISLYFVPSLIAYYRATDNRTAIFWLNFLAGFTAIGWVVALILALFSAVTLHPTLELSFKKPTVK